MGEPVCLTTFPTSNQCNSLIFCQNLLGSPSKWTACTNKPFLKLDHLKLRQYSVTDTWEKFRQRRQDTYLLWIVSQVRLKHRGEWGKSLSLQWWQSRLQIPLKVFLCFHLSTRNTHTYIQDKYTVTYFIPCTTLSLVLACLSHFVLSQLSDMTPSTLS